MVVRVAGPAAVRRLALLAPIAALLAGCSFLSPTSTPAPTTTSTEAGPSSAPAAAGSSAPASAPSTDLPVLAQATTSAGQIPLRISVNRMAVSGELLQLTWSVTNTGSPDGTSGLQVAQFFSDGVYQAAGAFSTADAFSVDGVYLLDAKNAKRYLVARDPNKVCVCSGNMSGLFIAPGRTVTMSGTYKAPPGDVTTLTVVIPKTPPFENVPVQR